MGTIEHFDETEQAVREMARVLPALRGRGRTPHGDGLTRQASLAEELPGARHRHDFLTGLALLEPTPAAAAAGGGAGG